VKEGASRKISEKKVGGQVRKTGGETKKKHPKDLGGSWGKKRESGKLRDRRRQRSLRKELETTK